MRFALVSQQILSGKGLRMPIIGGGESPDKPDSSGTVPFLVQPPLLPIVYAIFGGVTPEKVWPAQVLNIFSHIMVAIFSCLIVGRLRSTGVGIATGIAVAFAFPLLDVSHYAWSEPLFIALVITSIWCLMSSRHLKPRWSYVLGSSCLSAAAIATRTAGVALLPLFLWEAILMWKNRNRQTNINFNLLWLLIPFVTVGILFTRSYLLSGTIRGFDQPDPERTWCAAIYGIMCDIGGQLGIYGLGDKFLLGFFFSVPLIFILIFLNSQKDEFFQIFWSGFDLVIVFIAIYTGVIIYTMHKYQPLFERRYTAPLLPFLIISAMVILDFGWRTLLVTRMCKYANHGLMLSLVLIIGLIIYRTYSHPLTLYLENANKKFVESQTYCWLIKECPARSIVYTNKAFRLAFFGGYPTLRLATREHYPNFHIPDDMQTQLPKSMSEVGARYLILFADRKGLDEKYYGKFISSLSKRENVSDKLTIMYECPDGVVYSLRK
jgi:multisubunit Na+/H+ antiporter MnhC subunit